MSYWTHITAAIDVDTCIEDDNIGDIVKNLLKHAPLITGSEGPADLFVNVLPGHNTFTSADCHKCPYGKTVHHDDLGSTCDGPDDYQCPEGEYQTRVVITVVGDLRDRLKEQTKREWKKFFDYIKNKINGSGFVIRSCACHITE